MRASIILITLLALTLAQEAPKVKIQLYFDSYCQYCQDFVTGQLYPTYMDLSDIMLVELFPFGNDKYLSDGDTWTFKCQHGDDECLTNTIHACAKESFKDIGLEMDFLNCLLASESPSHAGPTCAATAGVQWDPINDCSTSEEGKNLLHEVAIQQAQLDPELYFVPWIIVNDKFSVAQTEECKNDLKRIVCEMYNGTLPQPCGGYLN